MCDNNRDNLLQHCKTYFWHQINETVYFPLFTLMNLVHTCLFHKGFCNMGLWRQGENVVTLPHSPQRKHAFLGGIKQLSKTKKLSPRKKVALELLHQRSGHRSTRLLMSGDTANFWEDIEPRIYPDPLCTSCQVYSMKKSLGLKIH